MLGKSEWGKQYIVTVDKCYWAQIQSLKQKTVIDLRVLSSSI